MRRVCGRLTLTLRRSDNTVGALSTQFVDFDTLVASLPEYRAGLSPFSALARAQLRARPECRSETHALCSGISTLPPVA